MVSTIVKIFGEQGQNIKYYKDFTFTGDQYTDGCFMAMFPPKLLTEIKFDWKKSHGNIHWIGSEVASIGHGHLQGAVRSAEETIQKL